MLKSMCFDLMFDRPITDRHYISPGSYGIMIGNKDVYFDFLEYTGSIQSDKVIHAEVRELDIQAFPDSKKITRKNFRNNPFVSFYIYTGEDCQPEIVPYKLLGLTAEFEENGEIFFETMAKDKLDEMSKVLES